MTSWNLADVWELAAGAKGDATALICGDVRRSWTEFDRRANGLARTLIEAGLGNQDKVAQYLYNCNEYLESLFACFKASLVPVNTNYRYGEQELHYLWENADAAALVFHGAFTETVDHLRSRLPLLKVIVHVEDGTTPCPDWAFPYETAAVALEEPVQGPEGRSGDDLYMLYTGGTTGMPKGVMWRQDDLFSVINAGSPAALPTESRDAIAAAIEALAALEIVLLPACPLMHGTGAFTAFAALDAGGTVCTLPGRKLDIPALLDTVQREKVRILTIVGDAFARPIVEALDAQPERWDISSLLGMISSGVMWSEETKKALLRHNPAMMLVDAFSSSEAVGMGSSVSTAAAEAHTAVFSLGEGARIIDDRGRPVGPGVVGRLALAGRVPLGYYKDPEKTARTFPVIDGVRYAVPGDYATVDEDGTVHLLGRGSMVINTGGEKVYPEEVEEAIKTHPAVVDAAAVGLPDARFGETIAAVVELREPASEAGPTADEIGAHVRQTLAAYKVPRQVVFVDSLQRSPAGKLDYTALRRRAQEALGSVPIDA